MFAVTYETFLMRKYVPDTLAGEFQSELLELENELVILLNDLSSETYLGDPRRTDTLVRNSLHHSQELIIFTFRNDSLTYWSDNSAPFSQAIDEHSSQGSMIELPNGIYYFRDTIIGDHRIAGLFQIKHKYPYQNNYLENRFHPPFDLPPGTTISLYPGTYNIHGENGFLLSFEPPLKIEASRTSGLIMLLLYALAFIAICAGVFQLYLRFSEKLRSRLLMIIAFTIDVIILRALMFLFRIPGKLYDTYIFSPGSFAASDLIPSMGDFLFNALALLVIAYALFITYPNITLKKHRTAFGRYFLIFSLFLHIFIFYRIFLWAASSLILDASYSLNLNRIFFLSTESFIALLIFTLLLFSFFLVSYRILGLAFQYSKRSAGLYFILLIITTGVYALICIFMHDCNYLLFIPLLVYAVAFFLLSYSNEEISRVLFSASVLYLLLFAVISTAVISTYNHTRENEERKLLAIELSSGDDPLTEYVFQVMSEEMNRDTVLQKMLSMAPSSIENENRAIAYIEDVYLANRMRKYEWMVTLCTPDRSLSIQPDAYLINCREYFDGFINEFATPALGNNLYRYENEAGMCNYLSNQEYVLNDGRDTINIYIELFSFFIPEEGLGYPELLIDEKMETFTGLEEYSYARYKDGKLVFKYGTYPFSTSFEAYSRYLPSGFFEHNHANHYLYYIDINEYLIITREGTGLLEVLAPFSYLLIFFTLFILIFLIGVNFPFRRARFAFNFRNRLQTYLVSLIIVSFVIVGMITVNYVINLNTSKNKEILEEKTHSVLIELEHKLAERTSLTPDLQEYLTNLLIKFSRVFFSDINLYSPSGQLLASSRPEIFSKELVSTLMNADAYRILTVDKKLLFIHTETIGDQDYYSAYVPFMNEENKVVAYLNLPYFARQNELQTEISYFLNAFLNVYVLLIAIAIFIALLISRYTTQPLQMIRNKIGSLSLDGTNEKIKWSRRDEIGMLISEYNRMVDELSKSAELLAKSERESAWREMAKQVAHEIKNPLTPMKLSVQYLQRAWDEKKPDWEERLNRFTQTIIEHIDTLSSIATEFSDFAKMPARHEDRIDLAESIRKSMGLFSDQENIRFSFTDKDSEPHYVYADKNQLNRLFTNLIKNSVQAIGKQENGRIEIEIGRKNSDQVVRISDNGPGIPEEMMDKIFSPSFTTKSSGMGLGLALVKSIVKEAGGDVSFESRPGEGASFFVVLPAIP